MTFKIQIVAFLGCLLLFSCKNEQKTTVTQSATALKTSYSIELKELDDTAYPDNPDIEIRHPDYLSLAYSNIKFEQKEGFIFDIYVVPSAETEDTIFLQNIDLEEFIPSIPERVVGDDYLALIAVVNQEWNRNQVRFAPGEFAVLQSAKSAKRTIDRVDLARNCLNSYLWEFQYNALDGDNSKVIYHGWFDFPEALYSDLFKMRNGVSFDSYKESLVNWQDPPSKPVNLDLLRSVVSEKELTFKDKSDKMYPLAGERKKKFKEVITPAKFSTMRDLQSDASTFATFTPPGFYNRADPRKTELGRFRHLDKVIERTVVTKGTTKAESQELELFFSDDIGRKTRLIMGGLSYANFPQLTENEANNGWMSSMGISNHPFYEKYEAHENMSCKTNPYYALLLDGTGNWLDSHTVGIDGPMFHRDANNPSILNLWLLSFERHAFVGHYVFGK